MGKYSEKELKLLDKSQLISIILEQEKQLASKKGQPKRDNLIDQSFGALKVIGDAGSEQGHSVWHCRCSGDLYGSRVQGECDRIVTVWGSNLKAKRQQYCGDDSCPAGRQLLGERRRKGRKIDLGFLDFLESELRFKYAIAGKDKDRFVERDMKILKPIYLQYYGLNESGCAYRCEEIGRQIRFSTNKTKEYRQKVECYLNRYQKI